MASRLHSIPSPWFARTPCAMLVFFICLTGFEARAAGAPLSDNVQRQIAAIQREAESRTPAQRKLDSNLHYAIKMDRGQPVADGVPTLMTRVSPRADGRVDVDITANVSNGLMNALRGIGAEIVVSTPQLRSIYARVPLRAIEGLAERPDVIFVQPHEEAITWTEPSRSETDLPATDDGAGREAPFASRLRQALSSTGPGFSVQSTVTSQGDVTHQADAARQLFATSGAGIKIGVLSNGVNTLATRQANGELPAVTVLPGQAGSGDEGTAMLEIVHDIAPDAQLFYATANPTSAQFAQNIRDLRSAGCDIIIDDITYLGETPFQDGQAPSVVSPTNAGVVIQAVNDVTVGSMAGALYFSAAGNSGNKSDGTAGNWEGDFVDGGTNPLFPAGTRVHDFGGGQTNDQLTVVGNSVWLKWSDPLGASANDYDLYALNSAGTSVLGASTNIQNGDDDPVEAIGVATNVRYVIVQKAGAQGRFLQLNSQRGRFTITTTGVTFGHNACRNAISCAATPAGPAVNNTAIGPYPNPFSAANVLETFSSDGPRRIFYEADGTPITPGDVSSTGGELLQKPDITAADGVTTTTPGFNPFFGTSAAAPHAGALMALLKSANAGATRQQLYDAMANTAVDIEAPGTDRDAGHGIFMPIPSLRALGVPEGSFTAAPSVSEAPGNGNGMIQAGEGIAFNVALTNTGATELHDITATLTTSTPGIFISAPTNRAYSDIAASSSASASSPWHITIPSDFPCFGMIDLRLTVSYSGGDLALQQLAFSVPVGDVPSITTTLDATAPPTSGVYTATTGDQVARIFRNATISACGSNKANPGLAAVAGTRRYDAYSFTAQSTGCVTVRVTQSGVLLHSVAYGPGGFVPASPTTNYLADPGNTASDMIYAFSVTAGQAFTVVVHEVNQNAGLGQSYTLSVTGVPLVPCVVNQVPTAVAQNVQATAGAGCTAAVTAEEVDNGSSDPDGASDIVSYTLTPAGPYALGTTAVALTVTDSKGAQSQANASITVGNPAPVLTYANVEVTTGGSATIDAATGPSDPNGTVASIAVQDPGTYTGSISVNGAGKVSISNAAPGGTHTITLRATDNCGATADASFTLTVVTPQLSIDDVSHAEGNSGSTTYSFTVSLSRPAPPAGVTFDIATADGTTNPATAPSDYTARSLMSQIIAGGASTYTFEVAVQGDLEQETDETFLVNVTNVTGADVSDGQATGTITNDDVPAAIEIATSPTGLGVTIDDTPYTAPHTFSWVPGTTHTIATTTPQEGDPGTRYVFQRWSDDGAITHVVTTPTEPATLTASFGTQYLLTTSASPAAGGSVTPATGYFDDGSVLSVSATTNTGYTFAGFSGALSGTGNPQNLTLMGPASVVAFFTAPALSIDDVTESEGNSSSTAFTFTVSLSQPAPSGGVTFDIATTNGVTNPATTPSDYAARSLTSQTIAAGTSTYSFVVSVAGDLLEETDETFGVDVTNVTNADVTKGHGVGTILNDDVPVQITVSTSPPGLGIAVDLASYTAPRTFSWVPGTSHTIATTSPQNGGVGTRYIWNDWSDQQAITHSITTPASPITYTASFGTEYQLTTSASPAAGGSVTPATGYFAAGSPVQITATTNAGYTFGGFTGALTGTTNPQTLTMSAPASVVATFHGLAPSVIDNRIAAATDDAEESAAGDVNLRSKTLDLVSDGSLQTVGMRFANLAISKGAHITAAWIQFVSAESRSEATSLTIRAQAADNAETFTNATRNVSSRLGPTSSVAWDLSVTPWPAGSSQSTPDLSALVQGIVGRAGWSPGNALALIVTGSGHRTAVSWDGDRTKAPLLHVEFETTTNPNRAPVVDAGPNQTITMPASTVLLDGTVSDDGLPSVPGKVTTTWSLSSGPAAVGFADEHAIDTQASFTESGTYVLQLSAFDGEQTGSDMVTITVAPAAPATLERRVAASSDDAEESAAAAVSINSSTLDFLYDGSLQTVGMRFTGLGIPRGATITRAYLQFKAKESQTENTSVLFAGEASDNAATFTRTNGNISSRQRTSQTAPWLPGSWVAGTDYQTSPLENVIQAIVTRPGWVSGNALVLIATGTGHRTAYAFDGNAAYAPLLHVEFTSGGTPTNLPPVVSAGPGQTVTLPPGSAQLDGTVSDDGLPTPAAPTVQWTQDSGPGTTSFVDANTIDTQASFDQVGVYVLRLNASDGELSASDTVTVIVRQPAGTSIVVESRPAASADDAEENANGKVSLTSNDLELLYDMSLQTVGMRFPGIAIARGAQIVAASIQFTAIEAQSELTTVNLQGEASDNAAAFTNGTRNVSARVRTAETVVWHPNAWKLTTPISGDELTPDLKTVIQRIVSRPGWASGNALAIIATGTGHRTAYAWNGNPTKAPLLHIEYTTAPALANGTVPPERSAPLTVERTHAWVAPNPFRGAGTLHLALSKAGPIELQVFDVQGRQVTPPLRYGWLGPGEHALTMGADAAGRRFGVGLYFYKVATPSGVLRGRFMMLE